MTTHPWPVPLRDAFLAQVRVDAGAHVTIDWDGRTSSVLKHTEHHQDADVVRLLLDAGAPLPRRRICESLAEIARRSGADDLVSRLLPEG